MTALRAFRTWRSAATFVALGGVASAAGVAEDAGSPRGSLAAYLELCRDGRYLEAASHLDLPEGRRAEGAILAFRLKAALDRHVWFDLDAVSPDPGGAEGDGLPPGVEQIGEIPGPGGAEEPVRLVRQPDGRWRFSRGVVERVDRWYGDLPDHWLRERLPEPLFRPGPRELLWWQWLALPMLAAASFIAGRILGWTTRVALVRLAARTSASIDDRVMGVLARPVTCAWALALLWAAIPSLGLYQPAGDFLDGLLGGLLLVILFWSAARVVDVVAVSLTSSLEGSPLAASIVPLGVRGAKVAVGAVAVVTVLSALGYPVASLVAGLGLGGLALALAAQKTVEHVFGSISIAIDQPIKAGDFVRVEGDVGTVESIGLRSTQIRTLDRTLVTIPNGRLADMRLESFSARDRMRLACTVSLEYGTTASQMREVLSGLERVLREHPRIWPDAVVVRFKELASSSLDIEIMAWFQTQDWSEFQLIRQDVLLRFMEVVERARAAFAFPTRTVHVVSDKT